MERSGMAAVTAGAHCSSFTVNLLKHVCVTLHAHPNTNFQFHVFANIRNKWLRQRVKIEHPPINSVFRVNSVHVEKTPKSAHNEALVIRSSRLLSYY